MNRRGTFAGRLPSPARGLSWMAAALLIPLLGCAQQQARLQSEDEGDKTEVKTVKDVATFDNTEPIPVAGVGLVTGLADTGGDAPQGDYRTMMENELKKKGITNVKEILARKDVSLVLVSGLVPPGARKGDPVDIEVSLPPGSKTTSLRGGYLQACKLFNYELAQRVAPTLAGNNRNAVLGHPIVVAEGPLQVGLGEGDESMRLKQGRIWGGGRCRVDRPFLLVLNTDKQFAAMAKLVADRINETFQEHLDGPFGRQTAKAENNQYVVLSVPETYALNLPRYLRVVGLVPLRMDETGSSAATVEAAQKYRRRLEEEILDPARTITAALRLEALGERSRLALKRGLESENTLVRFSCAEALAYLNDPAGGKELGRLVVEQPALRAFCLTALASLDQAVSHDALTELLDSPAAETRYGAFRALRALNERDPLIKGEWLNDTFWLHRVASNTPGLVHVCGTRRAEVVLFGEEAQLRPPFAIQAGPFNVTAADEDTRCTIGRYGLGDTPAHRQCSLKLDEVLRHLANMGASYAEVVEVLRQAHECECVNCPVVSDALPQATSVYALKKAGERAAARTDGHGDAGDEEEILSTRLDLGATPNLFEKGDASRLKNWSGDSPVRKGRSEKKTAERSARPVE
jgi:flagellar basal body P-ring protein FlgI